MCEEKGKPVAVLMNIGEPPVPVLPELPDWPKYIVQSLNGREVATLMIGPQKVRFAMMVMAWSMYYRTLYHYRMKRWDSQVGFMIREARPGETHCPLSEIPVGIEYKVLCTNIFGAEYLAKIHELLEKFGYHKMKDDEIPIPTPEGRDFLEETQLLERCVLFDHHDKLCLMQLAIFVYGMIARIRSLDPSSNGVSIKANTIIAQQHEIYAKLVRDCKTIREKGIENFKKYLEIVPLIELTKCYILQFIAADCASTASYLVKNIIEFWLGKIAGFAMPSHDQL
jgi:hypothetical protein